MTDESIPADLREFVLRYIDSVAHLEALLLLRADAETAWDIATIARRLYTTEQQATEVLSQLCADGLLSCESEHYRYGGQSAEHRDLIDRLAEFYAKRLILITNMIHGKPRRIRQFADAFKLRKGG